MRRFLISIIGAFVVFSAFCAGENIPVTKAYVDSALMPKQDIIEHTTGANQVLTNTGTAGEYGTKGIYDSTASYFEQADALIDAVTMNTAVQNAIDSEFQCISWVDDNPTKDCLLMEIRGATSQSILPTGYTALEYIESTGTQYIDTGVAPASNFKIYIDGMITRAKEGRPRFFGTSTESIRSEYYSATLLTSCVGSVNCSNGGILYGGVGNRFYIGLSPHWVLDYNGTQVTLKRVYSPSGTFTVLGTNANSSKLPGRIYEAKLYDGDVLVFRGLPGRRDSDGAIGLYDTVRNVFLTNSGTGEFIAGPVVNLYLPAGE